MEVVEHLGDGGRDRDDVLLAERASLDDRGQRFAVDELLHEVVAPAGLERLDERRDVRVVELAQRVDLALEQLQRLPTCH